MAECFDRDAESTELWRQFRRENDVLMLAPRRLGKTFLLNRLQSESEQEGFRAIVVDVEGFREEKAFFQHLCASIQEEIGYGATLAASLTERLKRVVRGGQQDGDWRAMLLAVDWPEFAEHLLAQLEEDGGDKPWVLLIDEITIFTKALADDHDGNRAGNFLYQLRRLARHHPRIRWLFTGSIGLDTIARRGGFEGALVDLGVFSLRPFSEEIAARFLQHVAQRENRSFSNAAIASAFARLGWLSPYYLEKLAEEAIGISEPGVEISPDVVDQAADALLKLEHRVYWSTWREHLDKNFLDPERTRLHQVLTRLAQGETGESFAVLLTHLNSTQGVSLDEEALQGLLDTLEYDGYITSGEDDPRYRFRMSLLREWWLRHVSPRSGR